MEIHIYSNIINETDASKKHSMRIWYAWDQTLKHYFALRNDCNKNTRKKENSQLTIIAFVKIYYILTIFVNLDSELVIESIE